MTDPTPAATNRRVALALGQDGSMLAHFTDWYNDLTACFRDLVPVLQGLGVIWIETTAAEAGCDWSFHFYPEDGESQVDEEGPALAPLICAAFLEVREEKQDA